MKLDEKKRLELINKSINADKTKSYGTTRYVRKDHVHVFNTVKAFNRIDMNSLWRADILSFKVPIHGESGGYEVEILFDGILDDIKQEIKANQNKVEYKCIYKAIIKAINNQDVYVGCTCPDYKFRFQFHATKGRYNAGKTQLVPARITNPNDTKGAACKHILNVLANLDWAVKLASTITNYIFYMQENEEDKFARLMYPTIYDMPYDKAVQLSLFGDPDDNELANSMDNEEDVEVIDQANAEEEEEIPVEDIEEPEEEVIEEPEEEEIA